MPIGQISDLLSVYLWIPIIFQFIDPRPRTPSGPFIGILLPTQGPVQACSSMGLCVTDSRPFGVSGRGPFSSPTECWSREGREKGLGLCFMAFTVVVYWVSERGPIICPSSLEISVMMSSGLFTAMEDSPRGYPSRALFIELQE